MSYSPYGRYLWQKQFDVTTSSNSTTLAVPNAAIDIHDATDLWLSAFVVGTPTGTTPTLNVQLDVFDYFGNLFANVLALTQLTGAVKSAQASIGVHVQGTGTSLVLPATCQVSWTIAGASAKFPGVCISLLGR